MTDTEPLEPAPGAESSYSTDARPRAGCVFLLLPLGFAAAIMLGYVTLFGFGSLGFTASGERVEITLDTCEAAHEPILARVEMMGLGDPQTRTEGERLILTATLPNTPAAAGIPATLARTGDFSIRAGAGRSGAPVLEHEDMITAEFSTKELGNPLVIVKLKHDSHKKLETYMEAHNTESITVWVDEEAVLSRPCEPPFRRSELDVRAEGPDGQDNMTRAVNWSIVMTHGPLPCPTRVVSTRSLTPAAAE